MALNFRSIRARRRPLILAIPGSGTATGMRGAGQTAALAGFNLANAANKKVEPEVIVDELPISYKQRKFLNDVTGISCDLFMIPGNIVTFHLKDTIVSSERPGNYNGKQTTYCTINRGRWRFV